MRKTKFMKSIIAICGLFAGSALASDTSTPQQASFFPIWGEQAKQKGYYLPKPYGFSINYLTMEQPLKINDISLTNVAIGGLPIPDGLVQVEGGTAMQESETLTLRADLWLFPFLNTYAILGGTKGSSVADVTIQLPFGQPIATKFELDFKGITYGVGTTVVGGVGSWFAMADVNYTKTVLDILDGEIDTIVFSPRVGYRWDGKGQVWLGAMYQNVGQNFGGNIAELGIPLINEGRFKVDQSLEENWNGLLGGQVHISKNIDVLFELGVGKRSSVMASFGYRF